MKTHLLLLVISIVLALTPDFTEAQNQSVREFDLEIICISPAENFDKHACAGLRYQVVTTVESRLNQLLNPFGRVLFITESSLDIVASSCLQDSSSLTYRGECLLSELQKKSDRASRLRLVFVFGSVFECSWYYDDGRCTFIEGFTDRPGGNLIFLVNADIHGPKFLTEIFLHELGHAADLPERLDSVCTEEPHIMCDRLLLPADPRVIDFVYDERYRAALLTWWLTRGRLSSIPLLTLK